MQKPRTCWASACAPSPYKYLPLALSRLTEMLLQNGLLILPNS